MSVTGQPAQTFEQNTLDRVIREQTTTDLESRAFRDFIYDGNYVDLTGADMSELIMHREDRAKQYSPELQSVGFGWARFNELLDWFRNGKPKPATPAAGPLGPLLTVAELSEILNEKNLGGNVPLWNQLEQRLAINQNTPRSFVTDYDEKSFMRLVVNILNTI